MVRFISILPLKRSFVYTSHDSSLSKDILIFFTNCFAVHSKATNFFFRYANLDLGEFVN